MKDFNRTDSLFSLCGLNCGLCTMHLDNYCPGCGGGIGNQSCAIAKCSMRHHNVEYCYQCPEYPCPTYTGIEALDSFITHQNQLGDMAKAQRIGLDAYHQEQQRKIEILHTLLSHYNDGRRKSFFCLAVNLLPMADLENILATLHDNVVLQNTDIQQKAALAVSLCNQCAAQYGLILKLRKKPVTKELP